MSLPAIDSRHPTLNPWLDLSDYLVNGWEPFADSTCVVWAFQNLCYFNLRVNADNATDWTILAGVPAEVLPPRGMHISAHTPRGTTRAMLRHNDGELRLAPSGRNAIGLTTSDRAGDYDFSGALPRGTAT